ncbi:MAG: hypothetical protein NTX65_16585 [Ignavibacteriales bacterium]|nr:hypothetical protein [Ignavibacteriales bacterium]
MSRFQLVDEEKKERGIFSIRMDEEDINKLQRWAKEEHWTFHRFVKAVMKGYIVNRETIGKK